MNLLFKYILLLMLFVSSSLCAGEGMQQDEPRQLDIYLCIGQSNMAGRGLLTQELMDTLAHVYLLNGSDEFEPAVNPLNRYSTIRKEMSMQRLSLAYAFGKEIAMKTGHDVGLVVNARGGSSIESWLKGAREGYYEEALRRTQLALKQGGHLKAIIWHQGEADCGKPEKYKEQLLVLMSDLRHDLGLFQLPVVVGQLSQWNWTKRLEGTKPFNEMLQAVSSFLPYTACVSSEGLLPLKDETDPHFDTNSQLLLGKRYAEAVFQCLLQNLP